MKTRIFKIHDRIMSFGSISEEDLNKVRETRIMDPWVECYCDCCGRYISELKPFDKAGDPPDDSRANDFLEILEKACRDYGLSEEEIEIAMEPAKRYVGREFGDTLLVATSRRTAPYDEEAEAAMDEAMRCYERDGFDNPQHWMANKYGEEEGYSLCFAVDQHSEGVVSWECRDCINLGEDEYFKKLEEGNRRKKSRSDKQSGLGDSLICCATAPTLKVVRIHRRSS